ncbi:MAG TPA: aminotransferase [Rhodopila sp.]|uniref:aminotransferase n=1 Tax=Rhodopila sp. TaxID=2480087 RepID=UPI002BB1187B|nr:aminotransferase [Rhodopila sp.]HVY14155.1 aminotransferase [Rhodopila sp.]
MTPPPLSPRIRNTFAAPIPTAKAWATRYDGRAGATIDLTQAVPGYPTHPELAARLAEGATSPIQARYGTIDGDEALRSALAADMNRVYGADLIAADVAITSGANLAFTMAITVLCGTGDQVMLPVPWYFNNAMALTMQGLEALPLPCRAEDGFVPDPDLAADLITDRTRAIVLISPNNPTGAVYPPETLHRFADLCRRRGLWLILDESYRDFLPDAALPPHRLFQDPDWGDYIIHLYSFSKAYCVAGHRVGAMACGPRVRAELNKVLDTMQICPPRGPLPGLTWAIDNLHDWKAANRAVIAERARVFREGVGQLPDWRIDALGTYFAYVRIPESQADAMTAGEKLATECGLLSLVGPFFGPGQDRHLRLAFANVDLDSIAQVPARLKALR